MIGQSLSNINKTCYSVQITKIYDLNKPRLISTGWKNLPKHRVQPYSDKRQAAKWRIGETGHQLDYRLTLMGHPPHAGC